MKSVITQMTLFMAALVLPAVNLEAQTLSILHSLNAGSNNSSGVYTNNDGTCPEANLLLSGNTLYGTAHNGGTNGYGTVFKVNTDGMGFTVLHTFTAPVNLTNIDGINPRSSLVLSSNTLYGTTSGGGAYGGGTVFAVNTNGTAFTNVYNFGSIFTSGYSPQAGLVLSGNILYGTTQNRDLANGAVFRINTDGTAFTNIHSFSVGSHTSQGINTNSDGIQPYSALMLASNVFYGTTQLGGTSGDGTVFRLNTDGTDFTNLHNFTGVLTSYLQTITNSDGANPYADRKSVV